MATTYALDSIKEVGHYWEIAHWGGSLQLKGPKEDGAMPASPGSVPRIGANQGGYDDGLFYDDNW